MAHSHLSPESLRLTRSGQFWLHDWDDGKQYKSLCRLCGGEGVQIISRLEFFNQLCFVWLKSYRYIPVLRLEYIYLYILYLISYIFAICAYTSPYRYFYSLYANAKKWESTYVIFDYSYSSQLLFIVENAKLFSMIWNANQ